MPDGSLRVPASTLRAITTSSVVAVGAPPHVAAAVADHLVEANLVGHDSHGIHMLPGYLADARSGEIHAAAEPRVEWERDAAALLSGEWAFGQYTGRVAMDLAIKLARRSGIALVGIVRVTHLGRMGAYMQQAARAGCGAVAFVSGLGGAVQAAPYGGARRAYGANPFAAGFPAAGDDGLVVDYATTEIAGGKVALARAGGRMLPPGVLLDARGQPSTDPEDLFRGGALTSFGGHKGYGLALLVELMGCVLTGSDSLGEPAGGGDRFGRSGATFIAMDADVFRPTGTAAAAAAAAFARVRATPALPDSVIRIPGERASRTREARLRDGIPLPVATVMALADAASGLDIDPDLIAALRAGQEVA